MNISSDLLDSPYGFDKVESQALTRPAARQGNGNGANALEFEKYEEGASAGAACGFSIPNQTSKEEEARVESLKALAQQIASQAEGTLSPTQEAQIKDIQKEIRKITNLPMGENLVQSAKLQAQANQHQAEINGEYDEDAESLIQEEAMQAENDDPLGLAGQPGKQMLHNKAFVTSVRTAGRGLSLGGSKGRL